MDFFSVNNVVFELWGYQMSWVELIGTGFNLWSVWLIARKKILSWPVGIVGVILFAILFWQIQLYSDLLEQIYYLITGFYGWWLWRRIGVSHKKEIKVKRAGRKEKWIYAGVVALGSLMLGWLMARVNLWLPAVFSEPASLPYLDAVTTVMSFAATILMAQQKLECWWLWILVDVIGVGLYFYKGVAFIALLYLIFLVIASNGWWNWKKTLAKQKK